MQKLLLVSLLIFGTLSQLSTNDVVTPDDVSIIPGEVGQRVEIVKDEITKMTTNVDCPNFRNVISKYKYEGDQLHFIFYHIYQCMNKQNVVQAERVYFSYTKNGTKHTLPKGCPPPTVEPPKEEDPCKMGFKAGQLIARTVSNLIVPQLLEDSASNPESETPEFQEILKLRREMEQTSDVNEFNDDQAKIIELYEQKIEAFAQERIKCFTENVIPNKKVDIEIICSQQGAYDSVHDALKSVLGDQISCGHMDCQAIEDAFDKDNMVHRFGLEGDDDWTVVSKETSLTEDTPDFNGNVQLPGNNTNYILQTAFIRQSKPSTLEWNDQRGRVNGVRTCSAGTNSQRFVFEKQFGFYRIRNAGSNKYIAFRKHQLKYVELEDENDTTLLWRIVINPDGSVTFLNRHNPIKTLGINTLTNNLNIRIFNKYEKYERFFIRSDCTDAKSFTEENVERYAFGGETGDVVVSNTNTSTTDFVGA